MWFSGRITAESFPVATRQVVAPDDARWFAFGLCALPAGGCGRHHVVPGTLHGLCRWRTGKLVARHFGTRVCGTTRSRTSADDGQWKSLDQFLSRRVQSKARGLERTSLDGRLKMIQCVGYDQNDGLDQRGMHRRISNPLERKTADGTALDPHRRESWSACQFGNHRQKNKLPPPVWLEGVTIDDKVIDASDSHSTSLMNVPPGGRRLDRFTALSFTAPDKVLFRHMLEGLDKDWSPPDKQRTVTYNYVPPGNYTFKVMACNDDGLWSTGGQSLRLQVPTVFLADMVVQNRWSRCLVVAAVLVWGVRQGGTMESAASTRTVGKRARRGTRAQPHRQGYP